MRLQEFGLRWAVPRWIERRRRTGGQLGAWVWMGVAFVVAVALIFTALAVFGTADKGIVAALKLTGRWSFVLFWPAYAGSAMATLFGPRFGPMARRGREFGLAYAAAQTPHFGLVGYLVVISTKPFLQAIMPFFALGVLWTYVLALSSVPRLTPVFGPQGWRIIRNIGLEYIALVFFADFVLLPLHDPHPQSMAQLAAYLPFSLLLVAAPLLRLAANARRAGLDRRLRALAVAAPPQLRRAAKSIRGSISM